MFNKLILILFIIFSPMRLTFARANNVLIFAATVKPAHKEIIPIAGTALQNYFNQNKFHADFTQDPKSIQKQNLNKYSALIFLDTSENVLNSEQQKTVENFFKNGRGILAIHSSISLGNDWPWFRSLIGTSFQSHPPIHSEKVNITLPIHPSAQYSPTSWTQDDEWYEFSGKLRSPIIVVATVNSKPISWCYEKINGGRFWYTAIGHSTILYTGEGHDFMRHLLSELKLVSATRGF